MSETDSTSDVIVKRLNNLFGNYRAEWNGDDIFQHFATPVYFTALQEFRPCVLQGGRGSGKTTALRGLSYEGQYELHGSDIGRFDQEVLYVGLYHRIDTNHVRSFRGGNISTEKWQKYFAHYFNLVVLFDIVNFLSWHKRKSCHDVELPHTSVTRLTRYICGEDNPAVTSDSLLDYLDNKLCDFQNTVNNISSLHVENVFLSVIGEPIEYLLSQIRQLPQCSNKCFYILLDEYENLEDYQQVLLNTMIKHSASNFTFKIGVRELGWRKKYTLNHEEILNDPADYVLLDIPGEFLANKTFYEFARQVCQKRFNMVCEGENHFEVENVLEQLDCEAEAIRLGVEDTAQFKEFEALPLGVRKLAEGWPSLFKFSLVKWAESRNIPLIDYVEKRLQDQVKAKEWYENYKYNMLFKIKKGRGSGCHQKLYAGFNTFVKLAHGNIRFMMELIYKTFEFHLLGGGKLGAVISAEMQTDVAKRIGEKNLAQLEGESRYGTKIVRMMFGLGRVFEKLAKSDTPTAAEKNQFVVEDLDSSPELQELLTLAVKNLGLIRSSGNKLSGYQTKDFEYALHPIFAPFFTFSYRKKRKMVISAENLIGLASDPSRFVERVLKKQESEEAAVVQSELEL